MAQKYRKLPVEIEAVQVPMADTVDQADAWGNLEDWLSGMTGRTYEIAPYDRTLDRSRPGVSIITLEGTMHADPGDWIIKGVSGEFYPYKPAIFEQAYEPVEDEEDSSNEPESTDH